MKLLVAPPPPAYSEHQQSTGVFLPAIPDGTPFDERIFSGSFGFKGCSIAPHQSSEVMTSEMYYAPPAVSVSESLLEQSRHPVSERNRFENVNSSPRVADSSCSSRRLLESTAQSPPHQAVRSVSSVFNANTRFGETSMCDAGSIHDFDLDMSSHCSVRTAGQASSASRSLFDASVDRSLHQLPPVAQNSESSLNSSFPHRQASQSGVRCSLANEANLDGCLAPQQARATTTDTSPSLHFPTVQADAQVDTIPRPRLKYVATAKGFQVNRSNVEGRSAIRRVVEPVAKSRVVDDHSPVPPRKRPECDLTTLTSTGEAKKLRMKSVEKAKKRQSSEVTKRKGEGAAGKRGRENQTGPVSRVVLSYDDISEVWPPLSVPAAELLRTADLISFCVVYVDGFTSFHVRDFENETSEFIAVTLLCIIQGQQSRFSIDLKYDQGKEAYWTLLSSQAACVRLTWDLQTAVQAAVSGQRMQNGYINVVSAHHVFCCRLAAHLLTQAYLCGGVASGESMRFEDAVKEYLVTESAVAPSSTGCSGSGKRVLEELVMSIALFEALDSTASARESEGSPWPLEVETIVALVCAQMELEGIGFRDSVLRIHQSACEQRIKQVERLAEECVGHPLLLSSPQQVANVIYNELQLIVKGGRSNAVDSRHNRPLKGTTGIGLNIAGSTSEGVLMRLLKRGEGGVAEDVHPFPRYVLEFRALHTLLTRYIMPLCKIVESTGQGGGPDSSIRAKWNVCSTATGRLSCSNPNLQCIPSVVRRSGSQIVDTSSVRVRNAFVPRKGRLLMSADYSQCELRVLAHCSKDATLQEMFERRGDIYKAIASRALQKPEESIGDWERSAHKTIVLGIMYGLGRRQLAENVGVSEEEAEQLSSAVHAAMPGLKRFKLGCESFARQHGYVETIAHRRRYLPAAKAQSSASQQERAYALRQALNSVIQGSAADIMKAAIVGITQTLSKKQYEGWGSIVCQLHDELLLEVERSMVSTVANVIRHEMSSALSLRVPLSVCVSVGESWGEMESLSVLASSPDYAEEPAFDQQSVPSAPSLEQQGSQLLSCAAPAAVDASIISAGGLSWDNSESFGASPIVPTASLVAHDTGPTDTLGAVGGSDGAANHMQPFIEKSQSVWSSQQVDFEDFAL